MKGLILLRRSGLLPATLTILACTFAVARPANADDPALKTWIDREGGIAKQKMFANISPPNCATGTVIASPSQDRPNYFFHWIRDGTLTMNQVVSLFELEPVNQSGYRKMLKDYATLSRIHQTSPPGSKAVFGLGEPKFLVNGQVFDGDWGRPQSDGPALRAKTLIRFAKHLLDEGDVAFVATLYDGRIPTNSVIKADLEYVGHHWPDIVFDLWEETRGQHFYTRMVQHRALRVGAQFARQMQDGGAADFYQGQSQQLEGEIEKHWNQGVGYIIATLNPEHPDFKPSQLDASIVLAAIHTDAPEDPFFGPTDDRILATAQKLAQTFRTKFKINQVRANGDGRALQPGIGRYPEDRYDGFQNTGDSNQGNPWFLTTSALAELCYRAAAQWAQDGQLLVTGRNADFLRAAIASQGISSVINPGDKIKQDDARFAGIITSLIELGDGYLRRVRQHMDQDTGSESEEFNHDTGFMQGARDLTWSYAALLTAFQARQVATKRATELAPRPVPVGVR